MRKKKLPSFFHTCVFINAMNSFDTHRDGIIDFDHTRFLRGTLLTRVVETDCELVPIVKF